MAERELPLCDRCNHKVTLHVVDDEERRECMEWGCSCEQYEHMPAPGDATPPTRAEAE